MCANMPTWWCPQAKIRNFFVKTRITIQLRQHQNRPDSAQPSEQPPPDLPTQDPSKYVTNSLRIRMCTPHCPEWPSSPDGARAQRRSSDPLACGVHLADFCLVCMPPLTFHPYMHPSVFFSCMRAGAGHWFAFLFFPPS